MRMISVSLRRAEQGFSYIMVMTAIVILGVAMSAAARQWKTMVQRELEADLLAKGIEIQNALALYSASAKAGRVVPGEVYPQTLADLTRLPKPFLRKVYLDPLGHGEWELVRAPTGGIMGVRSRSKSKPIKQSNFPLAVRHFERKPTHYDWVFQFPNPSMAALTPPGAQPLPAAPGQPTAPGGTVGSGSPSPPGTPPPAPPPAASPPVASL
ncbi:MAG: type II secretion system protein [Nitrospirae bacterium]|nr:type II secretion system protein [Nitrospirota bacterium]